MRAQGASAVSVCYKAKLHEDVAYRLSGAFLVLFGQCLLQLVVVDQPELNKEFPCVQCFIPPFFSKVGRRRTTAPRP